MKKRVDSQAGFALLAVLWFMMLLALIAASMNRTTRTSLHFAANVVEAAKAEALADGALWRGVLEVLEAGPPPMLEARLATTLADRPELRRALLARPEIRRQAWPLRVQALYSVEGDTRPWRRDGTVHHWRFGGGRLRISIQDEAGKIDLLTGRTELLRNLLSNAGLEPDEVERLARGLEERMTEAPHRPSIAVEAELAGLPGMSAEKRAEIASALTVYSRADGIDPAVAPRAVLLALPDVPLRTIDTLLAARSDPLRLDADDLTGLDDYLAASEREVVTIRAEAETDTGAVFVREAVIEVRRDTEPPFLVLDWRQGTR